ncbi:MAG: flagellar biosynthetic protein FliO [Methylococcaceae bacterium]
MNKSRTLGFKLFTYSTVIFVYSFSSAFAVVNNQTQKTVSYEHVLNWFLGLIMVLMIFFACVWFVRKTGVLPVNAKQGMRVVGSISLGMREKLILVQVGEKQLVLGVTPGRIENLLVLEGSEQLHKEQSSRPGDGDFANKLKQIMRGPENE